MGVDIEKANQAAFDAINNAQPVLVDVAYARDIFPDLDDVTIHHAGPPLSWDDMCGPLKGAVVGALKYEGLASNDQEATELVASGKIKFAPNHDRAAVGPMTGLITRSMPLFVVRNETNGNVAYTTINEGLGKVMRFGANDESVVTRLKWLEEELAPELKKAVHEAEGINLKVVIAQALTMGDEMHQRNIAASCLFIRKIAPVLGKTCTDPAVLERVLAFMSGNDQWFLNLAMVAGKATMDAAAKTEGSTVVSAMSRNGTNFGIRVSGLGDTWFEAPVNNPEGLYFPGFTAADGNPDIGDSAIAETFGIGGMAMAASPAVTQFVGAGSVADAIRYTREMGEICVGSSLSYVIPAMEFRGTPTGIDIRKVVETGILPVINTGIAHREAGVGQVGAGLVNPPMECFERALVAFAEQYNL